MTSSRPPGLERSGALVVSLDFELHWGVRDLYPPGGPYTAHLLGARAAIPAMLDLFAAYGVRATWATVGMLLAEGAGDRARFDPVVRPAYADAVLDPYAEPVGANETDDPLHFAPSLADAIAAAPGQELATHTYSHLYALEAGVDPAAFAADLDAACAVARARGAETRSLVFPRNQVRADVLPALHAAGLVAYRGTPPEWLYRPQAFGSEPFAKRAARLLDAHAPFGGTRLTAAWDSLAVADGLVDVRATAFLRPLSGVAALDALHTRRLLGGLDDAAVQRRVFHLWWHPHNFGVDTALHLERLERLLERFGEHQNRYGMESLTMAEVADRFLADRTC